MNVTFATYAAQKNDLLSNYLLANSIHDFAENLSHIPLRIYVSSDLDIQNEIKQFDGLNVEFSSYPRNKKRYRYAFKSAAASACELDVKTGNVIWLDRHMLVLGSCDNLLLSPTEQFAYRPPHLKILGASVDESINDMWLAAYKIAGVDESALFPVYTEVDKQKIWSYFSAGHFSFRAETCIMQRWDALFNELEGHQDMKPFLCDETVRVYLHQIALTLAVLQAQSRDSLKPLPVFYGYPTHLHNKMEKDNQASQMNQLHTAFYSLHNSTMPKKSVSKQLTSWLDEKVFSFKRGDITYA